MALRQRVFGCDNRRLHPGAGIAGKDWLTEEDVINTLPLEKLMKELKKKRVN